MTDRTPEPRAGRGCAAAITGLRTSDSGRLVVVTVELTDGQHSETRTLRLNTRQYCDLSPVRGPISRGYFAQLEQESRLCEAMRFGERLLAYAPNTPWRLVQKLRRRGFTREEAETAVDRFRQMGIIDEEADLRRETELCLRKLWGAGRIRVHLQTCGFSKESLSALPELLAEVDFAANCAELVRRRYGDIPSDHAGCNRVMAALIRYGYTSSEIRRAARLLSGEDD